MLELAVLIMGLGWFGSTVFLMFQIQKLINKLMSGNYGSYVQSETFQKTGPKEFRIELPKDEGLDEIKELNRLLL